MFIKDIFRVVVLIAVFVVAASCSRPKTIDDESLENIFRDIYLANAYCDTHNIITDSLDIYEPILKKYGYSTEDLNNTIRGFTRRKSSRLSDVIENAIKRLDTEYAIYEGRVAILDSIDNMAGERFKTVVYSDSIITATRIRDTSKLRIRIPVKEGTYKVSYNYLIDSLELNSSIRMTHYIYDSAGRQSNYSTNWVSHKERKSYTTNLETKATDKEIELLFGNYPRKDMKTPDMHIDSLRVVYYLPKAIARDSLTKILANYKLLIDAKEYTYFFGAQDSCARSIHPPRVGAVRDSVR